MASSGLAYGATLTTFDAPDSVNSTFVARSNAAASITGYYLDAEKAAHGFVRTLKGTFISFDVPGAPTTENEGTFPAAINSAGTITGYFGNSFTSSGFVRTSNGKITTFNVPTIDGTLPTDINDPGAIIGEYEDEVGRTLGFLRKANGSVSQISEPGASKISRINSAGVIAGYIYFNGVDLNRAFIRSPSGAFAIFQSPHAGTGEFEGTRAVDINAAGVVVGDYMDDQDVTHGYLRAANGKVTEFDVSGAYYTSPSSINSAGTIVGTYYDDIGVGSHNFIRANSGKITSFDLDAAGLTIDAAGRVVGTYNDAKGSHGFFRTP
jgi:hypothetical protein